MKQPNLISSLLLILLLPFLLADCKKDSGPDKAVISKLSPATGREGSVIVITGTSLGSAKKILFGTVEAIPIDPQGEQVTTQVPAGVTLGSVSVTVINGGGSSNALDFTAVASVPSTTDGAPVINAILPATSYPGFPLMIRGYNLAGTSSVTVGTLAATILTDYDSSMIVVIPSTISTGKYAVTIKNGESIAAGIVTIVTAPAGAGSAPSVNFVSPPPANFVNVVSNEWSIFTLDEFANEGCNGNVSVFDDPTFCGRYVFKKNADGVITDNYFEFTRTENGTPVTYYGQWSATKPDPCIQELVFINGTTGTILNATVDVSGFAIYNQDGTCN